MVTVLNSNDPRELAKHVRTSYLLRFDLGVEVHPANFGLTQVEAARLHGFEGIDIVPADALRDWPAIVIWL